jgi:hypothetical protein
LYLLAVFEPERNRRIAARGSPRAVGTVGARRAHGQGTARPALPALAAVSANARDSGRAGGAAVGSPLRSAGRRVDLVLDGEDSAVAAIATQARVAALPAVAARAAGAATGEPVTFAADSAVGERAVICAP